MMTGQSFKAVVDFLKLHGIKFEPGLSDDEITRIEGEHRFRFPPDFRLFLQTALPVTGGFPNWRSESTNELRRQFLDRPKEGVLFDVEHNDFWLTEWGVRPAELAEALAEAGRRLEMISPLIPIRSHHYLPSDPSIEGNPVLSVRQTDITCVGRDLPSYLMSLFEPGETKNEPVPERQIPFWTDAARKCHIHVPNMAGPAVVGAKQEYDELCRVARTAGFWAEVIPLFNGSFAVTFNRIELLDDRKTGVFWVSKRDFGWLICVTSPRLFFCLNADRVPELCLALLNNLPREKVKNSRYPFRKFPLDESIRREFGLFEIQRHTDLDDEREQRLRVWERLGWRKMSSGQMDEAWKRYWAKFDVFSGGKFQSPKPSTTWDISTIYHRGKEYHKRVESDLTSKALAALKKCTRPGEELLALNWNHTCYFFEPHAANDTKLDDWPVPILPDCDYYIFLASDFRFGIVGNCVDMTMCVFGQDLLAAFDVSKPMAFQWPTLTAEARRANRERLKDLGWIQLTPDEKEEIWYQFNLQFRFDQTQFAPKTSSLTEPSPSVTWSIAAVPGDPSGADNLLEMILAGLQKATKTGERLFALSPPRWYEHYSFDPQRLKTSSHESWPVSMNPDRVFVIFLAPDLRFGAVMNPVERTICVFGQELLEVIGKTSTAFGRVVRRNGTTVPD